MSNHELYQTAFSLINHKKLWKLWYFGTCRMRVGNKSRKYLYGNMY